MTRKAKELVQRFVSEELSGEVKNFLTFDFKTLHSSPLYGAPERGFDCDDTELARAVYTVIWGKYFPELDMDEQGNGKKFRGDTMNSFHTMFGRAVPGKEGFFAGVEKYAPSEEFREKVRVYGKICSNLGNFTLLPHLYACDTTLNFHRGTNSWRDFFDRFLAELHKVLCNGSEQDAVLKKLVSANDFFFRHFYGESGAERLLKIFFLEGYVSCDGKPSLVFPYNYHWRDTADREGYFRDAELYMEKASAVILARCGKMIEALNAELAQK